MPHSHVVDGKVLDIKRKKHPHIPSSYVVFLGDYFLGYIFKTRFGYDVLFSKPISELQSVYGMASIWKCYELMLKAFDINRGCKRD